MELKTVAIWMTATFCPQESSRTKIQGLQGIKGFWGFLQVQMLRKPGRICSTTWTLGCRDEGNAGNFWMLLAWTDLKLSTLGSLLLIHSCSRKSQILSSSISTVFQSLLRKMVEKEMKAAKACFTAHFLIRKTKCDSCFSIVFQCLVYHPGPSKGVSINHPLGFIWHPLEGAGWHSTRFLCAGKPLQGEPRALSPPCRGGKAVQLARWCRESRRFIEIQHMDIQKLATPPQVHWRRFIFNKWNPRILSFFFSFSLQATTLGAISGAQLGAYPKDGCFEWNCVTKWRNRMVGCHELHMISDLQCYTMLHCFTVAWFRVSSRQSVTLLDS